MNAQFMAQAAYAGKDAATRTPRAIEYEVFARITQRLRAAASTDAPGGFAQLAQALHDNRKLWTTLAMDLADNGNALPVALRARLFYLSEFTAQHTSRVLVAEAGADVLIDINTAVMRGLQVQGGAG